jgi:hypothetical protein
MPSRMVGYAWMNALRFIGIVATLTHPTNEASAFAGATPM